MKKMLAAIAAAAALSFSGAAQAWDWEGFYVGGQVGYGWSEAEVDIPNYVQPTFDVDTDGWIVGAFAGTSWNVGGPWSVGIDVEGNWRDSEGSAPSGAPGETYDIESDWSASVRGTVGYDVTPATEVYVAAGAAWTEVTTNYTPGGFPDDEDTLTGWTAAVGVSHDYNENVFTAIEGRYTDYGDGDCVHGGPSNIEHDE
ncbi:MAG: outer membrane protein, partial [Hyphomonadaceae bacterium]